MDSLGLEEKLGKMILVRVFGELVETMTLKSLTCQSGVSSRPLEGLQATVHILKV